MARAQTRLPGSLLPASSQPDLAFPSVGLQGQKHVHQLVEFILNKGGDGSEAQGDRWVVPLGGGGKGGLDGG